MTQPAGTYSHLLYNQKWINPSWALQAERLERRWIKLDKLVLSGIILERFVTRLFSEKLGLLPGWTNFLDYPLLVFFAAYVLLIARRRPRLPAKTGFEFPILALIMVFGLSALANLDRIHPGAITLFFVGLMEPMVFMFLAYKLNPAGKVTDFLVKVLVFVGWLQVAVVILIDLPKFFATGIPDFISGTFGDNAYQMTFVLMGWNALILSRKPGKGGRAVWFIGAVSLQGLILGIILLAQFRAFIPFALLTWGLTYIVASRAPVRAIPRAILGMGMFVAAFFLVNTLFPGLRYQDFLELSSRQDEVIGSGKVQSVLNYFDMVGEQPLVLLTGTGPGTYASRGFRTFSIAGKDDAANQLYRSLFHTDFYITDVAARYVLPVASLFAFGSSTAAVPWFSFLAIPAELGLPGLALVLLIYGKALQVCWRSLRRKTEQSPLAIWVFIAMVLLLQMGFIENWLEVSRLTVPLWVLFGVVLSQLKREENPSQQVVA